MFDILIKNGQIVDGSGEPAFMGDIAVKDGKIAMIAPSIDGEAKEIIDASGLQVTPGLIDSHTHSDKSVYWGSDCYNYLEQGVTTQIAGQCGASVAPYYDALESKHGLSPEEVKVWKEKGSSPAVFMKEAEKASLGNNMAYFIGHCAIRGKVMDFSDAAPTKEQMEAMKAYIVEAMEAGFLGMSTGLVYAPSVYADTEELIELTKAMKPYNGMYVSHIRGEGINGLDSVKEAIRIGEEGGAPVFISHLKVLGKQNEGNSALLIKEMDEAVARGVEVWADQYPFTASSAPLLSQIPPKYLVGGTRAFLERIQDPENRKKILYSIFNEVEEFESSVYSAGFEGSVVSAADHTPQYVNMSISEIANQMGKEPIDAMCDILKANHCAMQGIYFNQCASDLIRIMSHPRVFCGSDWSNYDDNRKDPEFKGGVHPRGTATMIRRLELVRDFRLRTMEQSIRNVTYDTAQAVGIDEHGLLKEGWDANICIMDYKKLHATADYEHPYRRNQGIHYVLVNGAVAVRNGIAVGGVRNGKLLKRRGS